MASNSDFHIPSHRAFHRKHVARSNLAFGPGSQVAWLNLNALEAQESQSNSPVPSSLMASTSPSASPTPSATDSITSTSSLLPTSSAPLTTNTSGPTSTGSSAAVGILSQAILSTSTSSSSSPTAGSLIVSTIPTQIRVSTATASQSASTLSFSVAVVVSNPSTTPEPSKVSTSATSVTQSPVFYIGLILGVVVIVACVSTVIAWWLRVRNRDSRKSRELQTRVPWARSSTVSSDFFRSDTVDDHTTATPDLEKAEIESAMSLRRGESEKLKLHLELMGDRDAGMPKRTQSYIENANSPVKRRSLPILTVPSPPPCHQGDRCVVFIILTSHIDDLQSPVVSRRTDLSRKASLIHFQSLGNEDRYQFLPPQRTIPPLRPLPRCTLISHPLHTKVHSICIPNIICSLSLFASSNSRSSLVPHGKQLLNRGSYVCWKQAGGQAACTLPSIARARRRVLSRCLATRPKNRFTLKRRGRVLSGIG